MNKNEAQPEQPVVAEQVEQPASEPSLSPEMMEVITKIVTAATERTIEKFKKQNEEQREWVEQQNNKISDLVQSTQASIMKPSLNNSSYIDYVKRVLEEDEMNRMKNPKGIVKYGETGEDLTKAKIILLKKIGRTDEEIAKDLFDN